MSTTTEAPVIRRRPKTTAGNVTARSFKCPDDTWTAALAAAHARGITLASYLVARLEELVAEDT